MTKLFGKKGRSGAGDDDPQDLQDDMTITSGWSRGGASVSDRIMGRMKKNLSFRVDGTRTVDSSSSVGDYRRKSPGRFKMQSSAFSVHSEGTSNPLRSRRSDRNYSNAGIASSVAGVDAMEGMDSSEAMALKGQTFGRRRQRQSPQRQRQPQRKLNEGKWNTGHDGNGDEPVTYSLAELRAMSVEELEEAMSRAGVPPEDISNTLYHATNLDTSDDVAEEQRKNMVALFVNSGCVKLVPLGKGSEATPPAKDLDDEEEEAGHTGTQYVERHSTLVSFKSDSVNDNPFCESLLKNCDNAEAHGSSIKTSDSKDDAKRSKLEKIIELKQENSQMKRENKSLKKTMKRMMGQLGVAIKERDKLQNNLEKRVEEESQQEASNDLPKSSSYSHLQSIHETGHSKSKANLLQSAENSQTTSGETPPCHDVDLRDSCCSIKSCPRLDSTAQHLSSSQQLESSAKATKRLMQKLKDEKEAHHHTQVKMQAEIEILTKEADGLQREFGLSLKSLDHAKKRARDSRESVSKLKRQLRNASAKIKESTSEAEARDALIDTFSKILLQRINEGEGGEGQTLGFTDNGSGNLEVLNESKEALNLLQCT